MPSTPGSLPAEVLDCIPILQSAMTAAFRTSSPTLQKYSTAFRCCNQHHVCAGGGEGCLQEDMLLCGLTCTHVMRLLETVHPSWYVAAEDDFTGERCRMTLWLLENGSSLSDVVEHPPPSSAHWSESLSELCRIMNQGSVCSWAPWNEVCLQIPT